MPTIMNRKWRQRLSLLVGLYLCAGAGAMSCAASPNDFKTEEYNFSAGLSLINGADAYALGYTGQGVVLGVADQYVNFSHSEFAGKQNSSTVLPVRSTYEWAELDHGTHVGGIMAAARNGIGMHGVAYDADLLSGELEFTEDFFKSLRISYQAFQADKRIKSINNSWGSNFYYDVNKAGFDSKDFREVADILENAIHHDKVLIFAAGNSGHPTPGGEGILPYLRPTMAKSFISVISVDPATFNSDSKKAETNFVSIFSDLAKYAEENSIAAPGDTIWSAFAESKDSYIPMSGTSMAAPHVTGVAGLVQQAFPYMNARQITDTLLSSANKNFPLPDYTVTMQEDEQDNKLVLKANLYYFGPKPDEDIIRRDLVAYYAANAGRLRKWYGYQDETAFVADVLKTGTIYGNVPREMIVGQGLLDAGAAVRGPGFLNARRMDSSNLSLASEYGKNQALYRIDTKGYDHSKWSNDIGERRAELLKDHGENPEFADLTAIYKYYIQSDQILSAEKKVTYTQGQEYVTDYNLRVTANGLQNLPVGLIKSGLGTLALSGTNSYTGSTVAGGGVLEINGSVAGDAWSVESGTIAGAGTITGSLYNQSVVRPGREVKFDSNGKPVSDEESGTWKAMPGTLTVKGNLSGSGQIAMAATSLSDHGTIAVTGSATIDGTTFIPVAKSAYQTGTYSDVVKAGTIKGVLSSQYAPFTLFLSAKGTVRGGNAVDISLKDASNFTSDRQQSTYQRIADMYSGQQSLTDFATVPAAQANGVLTSIYGGAQLNQAAIIQSDNTMGQAVAARLSYIKQTVNQNVTFKLPGFAPGDYTVNTIIPLEMDAANSWWLKTAKGWGSTSGRDGLPSLDNQNFSFVLGQDKRAGDHWRTGILMGYSQNTVTSSLSNTSSHGYRFGLYGGYGKEAFTLQTHLDYGRQGNTATRYLQDLLLQNLKAGSSYDSNTLSFGLSASYNLHHGKDKLWQVSPYADIHISRYNQDGYSESGSGNLSQIADPFANTYSTGEIGLEMARQIPKGRYAFRVGYKRVLSGIDPDMTIAYSGAPGSKLTIRGCEQDKQQLTFGLSIQGELAKDWTIDSQINHQQGANSRSLTAAVTLRKVW